MAISSPLNPGAIASERSPRVTRESAQNFISGGSPLGSSVVANAANKIVGFQRGTAGVAPKVPDLGSIIKTLSTNILNNVESRVQSINQNVNQFVSERVKDYGDSFRQRVQNIDAATPSKILQNFLGLYKNALDYIRFFADPRNVKRLGDNLKSLQLVFNESFQVAVQIRKTITRIINQLASLPTANAGGGGLNIDVRVPGGGLKKSAPRGLMRMMRRRPGMMLGGAALAGGGAAMATSALAKVGQDVEAQQTQTDSGLTGPIIDKFSAVLDRFNDVLQSLSNRKQQTPSGSGSGGGGTTPPPKDDKKGSGPSAAGPANFSGSESSEKAFNYFISQGYTKEQSAAIVGNLLQENRAMDPTLKNSIDHTGIAQWDPKHRYPKMVEFAKSKGLDPNTLEAQLQFVEQELQTGSGGLSKARLQGTKSLEEATLLVRKQYLRPGEAEAMDSNRLSFAQGVLSKYGDKVTAKPGQQGVPGKTGAPGVDGTPGVSAVPTVSASNAQQQLTQDVAQKVSQPVIPVQTAPSVNVLPVGGQDQPPVQATTSETGSPRTSTQVPFYTSSNDHNFLTLYSKMVYNIVDA